MLLMALAKERARRYDSAGQFARDIRRYLKGENIVARRPSAGYQLCVFSRRNKGLVGGVAVALIVLTAGVLASSVALKILNEARVRESEARVRATKATDQAKQEKTRAADEAAERMGELHWRRRATSSPMRGTSSRCAACTGSGWTRPGTRASPPRRSWGCSKSTAARASHPVAGSYGRAGVAGGFRGHTRHAKHLALLSDGRTAH